MSNDNSISMRHAYHQALDEFLDNKEKLLSRAYSDEERIGWSRVLLSHAADLASFFCGEQIVKDAYGTAIAGDRQDALDKIPRRLLLILGIYGREDRADVPGSLTSVMAEVRAIAMGDDPKLFKKLEGRVRRYRLALLKLRALEWNAYLSAMGLPAFERQGRISIAYGYSWDTISRWADDIRPIVGDKTVDDAIRQARLTYEYEMHALLTAGGPWEEALTADGKKYLTEIGFSLVGEK